MERHIANALVDYLNNDYYPWHMPGHKRKCDAASCKVDNILNQVAAMDVTEVPGLGDLYDDEGIIANSQAEITKIYNTSASYYLVNGSTAGNQIAIATYCSHNDTIIVAENCHKSVRNICDLLGLNIVNVNIAKIDGLSGVFGCVDVNNLRKICENNKTAKAVVITSPTYEGIISDIEAISRLVHEYGMKLIVDEAHGAHLPFAYLSDETKNYPKSSIYLGADIVVQSFHKTMSAMTQTAILHCNDEAAISQVKKYLQTFMSSSPSYLMMCSMERAVWLAVNTDYKTYFNNLYAFRKKTSELKHFSLMNNDLLDKNNIFLYDVSRIVLKIDTLKAPFVEKLLMQDYKIVVEMSGISHIVLISSPSDTMQDFERLFEALHLLDERITNGEFDVIEEGTFAKKSDFINKETLMSFHNQVADMNLFVYPPGIIIVPRGEVVDDKRLDLLLEYYESGKKIWGTI